MNDKVEVWIGQCGHINIRRRIEWQCSYAPSPCASCFYGGKQEWFNEYNSLRAEWMDEA